MRKVRPKLLAILLLAAGCSSPGPGEQAAPQDRADVRAQVRRPAIAEHFIEIETDSGALVPMSPRPDRSGDTVRWRARDGKGEVVERSNGASAEEGMRFEFRVVSMPAGREAVLHLPIGTRDGVATDIAVNGAPLEVPIGTADARILLGRDEATRISIRVRAR